jgi:polyhydroxybutyrate depolymerase
VAPPVYLPAVRGCNQTPVSVLFIHGTDDRILPWDRVRLRTGQVISLSAFDSFAFWAQRNGCSADPGNIQAEELPNLAPDDNSTVRHLALVGCVDGTEVQFYGVEGGGHTWPGHPFNIDLDLGTLNRDIDASEVIMRWLAGPPVRGSEETPEAGDS